MLCTRPGRCPCVLPKLVPRIKKDAEYLKMIDKYCKILRQRPYFMDAAATALELWAHGTEPPEQPLDIGSFRFAGQRAPI